MGIFSHPEPEIREVSEHHIMNSYNTYHYHTYEGPTILMEEYISFNQRIATALARCFLTEDKPIVVITSGRPIHFEAGWHHNEEQGYIIGKSSGANTFVFDDAIVGCSEVLSSDIES